MEDPKDEEFFPLLIDLDLGALKALKDLGLCDKEKPPKDAPKEQKKKWLDDQVKVISQLHHQIKEALREINLEYLIPDIIHFEHLLCKVCRVLGRAPELYKRRLRSLGFHLPDPKK